MFKENAVILFQGDSITDTHRSRTDDRNLGEGYVDKINTLLQERYPERGIKVLNRGISGNRTVDLLNRWEEDCIKLAPDYLSILIGVNDTGRRYDSNDPTSADDFADRLRTIIEMSLNKTSAEIILLNPFLVDINENITHMREDLSDKQAAVKSLAAEYKTRFLDLDELFRTCARNGNPGDYAQDGVHPTSVGHALIAEAWLKAWAN
ncbi:MAG: SGNH/GDSL hydrolase family protein [Acutalibacteraceae bacterium]|jgi:acyl-CoA thioesterase-1